MQIRSGLLFLKEVGAEFPRKPSTTEEILKCLQKIEKEEGKRADLQLMARSSITNLMSRTKKPGAPSAPAPSTVVTLLRRTPITSH
jgi:Transcription factor/nuclear export subunit protein 2